MISQPPTDELVPTVTYLWNTALTALWAILGWTLKRASNTLDDLSKNKANRIELEEHRAAVDKEMNQLRQDFLRAVDKNDDRHSENLERLDRILTAVNRRGN